MSEQITVLFTQIRRFHGTNADGESEYWCPEGNKEYCVTLERVDERLIYLTLPNGLRMGFLPPGESTNYTVIREGWRADDGTYFECVKALTTEHRPPPAVRSAPILESAFTLEIEPTKHHSSVSNTEYFIYKLPRTLNGLLVDRGYCDQEVVADRANPECIGLLRGIASFMLTSRNSHLRYQCVSFRIDNITTKKNLTKQYFCGSVLAV